MPLRALIFDVDGTLAETEEAHRVAFNETFAAFGLSWEWSRADYRDLLRVTGGKERIAAYQVGRAEALSPQDIARLHVAKGEFLFSLPELDVKGELVRIL